MSRFDGSRIECARLWLSKLERMHFSNYFGLRSIGRFTMTFGLRPLAYDGRSCTQLEQIQYWESIAIGQLDSGGGVDIGFRDAQLGLNIIVEM